MRHRNRGRKLGLVSAHRTAMLRQLVEALFLHGRIRTTVTRAKEVRRTAERIITWGKKGTLHHRRLAFAIVSRQDVVNRIFDHMVEWYKTRQGGYTRIIKLGPRPGDNAEMCFIELVDWIPGEKLVGQHSKQVKKPEGEESQENKEKAKKEKKEKAAKPKAEEKKAKAPAVKDEAKEKKKAERQAELEKRKQEKSAAREKVQQARLAEQKTKIGRDKAKAAKIPKSKGGGK